MPAPPPQRAPSPDEDAAILDLVPRGDAIDVDRLCGDWWISQLRKGHRFSTDDMVIAWVATGLRPEARRQLDIGAGTGSVGLMSLHRLSPEAELVMIEAQEVSHRLARRTVRWNGLQDRVRLRHGDLRDPAMLPAEEHGTYPLVTGSPPYIPVGKGLISPHTQRAHCRIELRGDVFDYCETARRALAPGGLFVFAHSAVDARPEEAVAEAGLVLQGRTDVYFRRNRAPTIAVFACGLEGGRADPEPIVVREATGEWTETYLEIRRAMGAPDPLPRRRRRST